MNTNPIRKFKHPLFARGEIKMSKRWGYLCPDCQHSWYYPVFSNGSNTRKYAKDRYYFHTKVCPGGLYESSA